MTSQERLSLIKTVHTERNRRKDFNSPIRPNVVDEITKDGKELERIFEEAYKV